MCMRQPTPPRLKIAQIWERVENAPPIISRLHKLGRAKPDAWVKEGATKIGYEIRADITSAEQEVEGLLDELLKGGRA